MIALSLIVNGSGSNQFHVADGIFLILLKGVAHRSSVRYSMPIFAQITDC